MTDALSHTKGRIWTRRACRGVAVMAVMAWVLTATPPARAAGHVTVYPAPEREPASADYQVFANGKPVFCYTSYRFDMAAKTTLAGRPVSPVTFCSFDAVGEVEVEVRMLDGLRQAGVDTSSVVVRPLASGIRPRVTGGSFGFRVAKPCQLSIEPGGGLTHPLHLFVNPPEQDVPDPQDPRVHYFGPGVHELGMAEIEDGETVYIAGGAVVYLKPLPQEQTKPADRCYGLEMRANPGMLTSNWHKNVTIRGRGILCGRRALEQRQRGHVIRIQGCEGLTIEGIIIRESSVWSLNIVNCKQVRVTNVKVIGHYVNNDGICIGGTSDALVEDCFCHNADDALEVKVWIPQHNVTFRNCVVWTDVGGAFGLCCESGADLSDVLFENCTVLHATCPDTARGAIGIELQGTGAVTDFRFRSIVIEDITGEKHPAIKVVNNWDDWHMGLPAKPGGPYEQADPPKRERPRGAIRGVIFENVTVLQAGTEDIVLMADGAESPIEDVILDNVTVCGRRLAPGDGRLKSNAWVRDVKIR